MKRIWKAITGFIYKDVNNKNESNRLAVVIRLLSICMCFYYIGIFLVLLFMGGTLADFAITLLAEFVCAGIFFITYKNRTRLAFLGINISLLLWTEYMVMMKGWGTGSQNFLIVLIVLSYFSYYEKAIYKNILVAVFCLLRLTLYWYSITYLSASAAGQGQLFLFQICNTIVVFIALAIIAGTFGKRSLEMERKLVAYNKKLEKQAATDMLTGMCNRRRIFEILDHNIEEERSYKRGFTIAIGDIDFFKKINDTYGHECGDEVLRRLAALMKEHMLFCGTVGRWGGEEFLLIFENANGDQAYEKLQELVRKIRALEIDYMDQTIKITMTFGVSEYNNQKPISETIKEADEKLYMGKEAGRNIIIF